jgi:hypothetical protein
MDKHTHRCIDTHTYTTNTHNYTHTHACKRHENTPKDPQRGCEEEVAAEAVEEPRDTLRRVGPQP